MVEFRNTDQVVSGDKLKSVSLEVVESSAAEAVELELVRRGKVRCRTFNGQKIIKFCMTGDHLPVNVTDMDLHILSIKETIADLETHTSSLAKRTARMKKEARNHLQQKHRELALSYLRRGRGAQQKLVSKAAMLANVEDILHQIQMAETNALVLEAYQKGRDVLKTINDDMLTAAEEVVDELHEVIQESEEVGAILGGNVENEELERELEALLSGPDSSTKADDLAEQLSKLELVSPPDADPTQIMAQKKIPAVTPLH
jgi:charged multivesicular body protein 7